MLSNLGPDENSLPESSGIDAKGFAALVDLGGRAGKSISLNVGNSLAQPVEVQGGHVTALSAAELDDDSTLVGQHLVVDTELLLTDGRSAPCASVIPGPEAAVFLGLQAGEDLTPHLPNLSTVMEEAVNVFNDELAASNVNDGPGPALIFAGVRLIDLTAGTLAEALGASELAEVTHLLTSGDLSAHVAHVMPLDFLRGLVINDLPLGKEAGRSMAQQMADEITAFESGRGNGPASNPPSSGSGSFGFDEPPGMDGGFGGVGGGFGSAPSPAYGGGGNGGSNGGHNGGWNGGRGAEVEPPAIRPAAFAPFETEPVGKTPSNLELLLDVTLRVTVELGRTNRTIRDILDLGPGSVLELDRLAGEPVDILVNDRPVARGEVVVVEDENFGVRVTDIISPARRLASLR